MQTWVQAFLKHNQQKEERCCCLSIQTHDVWTPFIGTLECSILQHTSPSSTTLIQHKCLFSFAHAFKSISFTQLEQHYELTRFFTSIAHSFLCLHYSDADSLKKCLSVCLANVFLFSYKYQKSPSRSFQQWILSHLLNRSIFDSFQLITIESECLFTTDGCCIPFEFCSFVTGSYTVDHLIHKRISQTCNTNSCCGDSSHVVSEPTFIFQTPKNVLLYEFSFDTPNNQGDLTSTLDTEAHLLPNAYSCLRNRESFIEYLSALFSYWKQTNVGIIFLKRKLFPARLSSISQIPLATIQAIFFKYFTQFFPDPTSEPVILEGTSDIYFYELLKCCGLVRCFCISFFS